MNVTLILNTVKSLFINKKIDRLYPYLLLCVCYSIVHGFILLNQSFFWDDWIWVVNPDEFRIALNELGLVFFKSFYFELFKQPVIVIRGFVFINYLLGCLFFYKALKVTSLFDRKSVLMCCLLFMVMPYNIIGRSSLCTAPYAFSFFLFFASFYAYLTYRKKNQYHILLVSVVLSTFSFNTPSFLVLYIVLFSSAELIFFSLSKNFLKRFIFIFSLFLVHTILFYLVKNEYFPTAGVYSEYNKPNMNIILILKLLLFSPYFLFEPLFYSLFGKTLVSSNANTVKIISVFLISVPLIRAILKKEFKHIVGQIVALALVLAALLPYFAVSKFPYTYNWDSRHQLLLPLGAALWLLVIFNGLRNIRFKRIAYSIMLLIFSFGTIRMYLSVQGLRYQDLALQKGLLEVIDPLNPAAYILINRGNSPGMMNHEWNFYELTGMIFQKTHQQNNPIILANHYNAFKPPELWLKSFENYKSRYMLNGAEWKPPFFCIQLTENLHMSEWQALIYLFDEYFKDEDVFNENIRQIYKLQKFKAESKGLMPTRC